MLFQSVVLTFLLLSGYTSSDQFDCSTVEDGCHFPVQTVCTACTSEKPSCTPNIDWSVKNCDEQNNWQDQWDCHTYARRLAQKIEQGALLIDRYQQKIDVIQKKLNDEKKDLDGQIQRKRAATTCQPSDLSCKNTYQHASYRINELDQSIKDLSEKRNILAQKIKHFNIELCCLKKERTR